MTGGTDHAADDALASAWDAGPPPTALVSDVEGLPVGTADDVGAGEPATSDGDVVDAGPPAADLVDDVEEPPADVATGDGGDDEEASDGDVIDAGPPPAGLGEEIESFDDM